ncbi:ATP-binding cassette permease mdl1 [Dimargaris xerosporica]|nr:ATP-binding cassette permease mdl1 [Dimargaris xerosporica]
MHAILRIRSSRWTVPRAQLHCAARWQGPELRRGVVSSVSRPHATRSFGFLARLLGRSRVKPAVKAPSADHHSTGAHGSHTASPILRSLSPTPPHTHDEPSTPVTASRPALGRLLRLARPEYVLLGGAVALLLVSSAVTMAVPFAMGKIIDIVATTSAPLPFGWNKAQFFTALASVFIVGGIANAGRVMLIRTAGERLIMRLRDRLYSALVRQDMAFFDQHRTGDLISRLANDTTVVGRSLSNNVSDGLRSLLTATAGLSMMVYMSPTLTGIMLAIVPPISVAAVVYGRFIRNLSHRTQDALGQTTKVAEERLGNIRTVQAFGMEPTESQLYRDLIDSVYRLAKSEAIFSGLFFGGAGLSGNLAIMAVLGVGGNMVAQQLLTIGQLTSFLLYTAYVGSSLSGITSFYSEIMKGLGASYRLFSLLDHPPLIQSGHPGVTPAAVRGDIAFDQVHFAYPSRPRAPIFDNLSFSIRAGTVVGIAGASGSGKSSIASLLFRFYDPQSGSIAIDGVPLQDLDLRWWRKQIALVSQEPVLFAGTIAENVAYGLETPVTEAQVLRALEQANCQFVHELPDGVHTFVGERGISLSGGQKQRVAIARALIKDPRVLILDEATSALDSENEYLMKEALEQLTRGRTVFTIAHRLSTLKSSDLILCLDQGRVVEVGPFAALMAQPEGYFRRLMEYQTHH